MKTTPLLMMFAAQLICGPITHEPDQPSLWDIGDPPAPPPNPHLQYWYTADVPGPDGVFPVEVFAPRLVGRMASDPGHAAEVPEPGTWVMLVVGLNVIYIGYRIIHMGLRIVACRNALREIAETSNQMACQGHRAEGAGGIGR